MWGVLLAFSAISCVLNVLLWEKIDHPLNCLAFATIEAAKIVLILKLSPTRLGVFMSICLFAAYLVNFGLYIDLTKGTNMVYDRYEPLLATICAAQLIPFAHGILAKVRSILLELSAGRGIRRQRNLSSLAYSGIGVQDKKMENGGQ